MRDTVEERVKLLESIVSELYARVKRHERIVARLEQLGMVELGELYQELRLRGRSP